MARNHEQSAIYEVASKFAEECLFNDGSYFWPGEPVWTDENLTLMWQNFAENPDKGDDNFIVKWSKQLAGLPTDVFRLAYEVTAIYCLFPSKSQFGPTAKRKLIDDVAQMGPDLGPMDSERGGKYDEAISLDGLGMPGTGYLTNRPFHIGFYLAFAKVVRNSEKQSIAEIEPKAAMNSAMELVSETMNHHPWSSANILLHLLWPDDFESTASSDYKRRIAKGLSEKFNLPLLDDVDDTIRQARKFMEEEARFDKEFSVYSDEVRPLWDFEPGDNKDEADEPADAWLFQANPELFNLDDSLRNLNVGDEDDWSVSRYRNDMKIGDPVALWQGGPEAGIYATGKLIDLPFKRPTADFWPDKKQREPTEWAVPFHYTHILRKPISKEELGEHPILKDLQVIRAPQGTNFRITPDQWNALEELIDSRETVRGSGSRGVEERNAPTIAELAEETHLQQSFLREIEALLNDKQQLIFEGPPGSGKTFVAQKFARYFTGQSFDGQRNDQIELVQFHQSYGYEDFVEGIRPRMDGGQLVYTVESGIFLKIAARAADNPDQNYVIIIDEINRGNVSRILGELMLLFEYRNQTARLPYSKDELQIPPNLYVIGTMNSADRSLSQIDYALRRRFYFVPFMSVENDEAPVLESWLRSREIDSPATVQLFVALNNRLREEMGTDDLQVGHSYFMREDIADESALNQVWKYAVMPLLREYLYHHRDRDTVLAKFEFSALRGLNLPEDATKTEGISPDIEDEA